MLEAKFFCLLLFFIPVQSANRNSDAYKVQYFYHRQCDSAHQDWRELRENSPATIHSNCKHVYVFFHGFQQTYRANWIKVMAESMKHGCAVSVEWKEGNSFADPKAVAGKLDELRDAIMPLFHGFPHFRARDRARVSFFGFDIGAYIAAAVASHRDVHVTELHAFDPTRVSTGNTYCENVQNFYGMPSNFRPENYLKADAARLVIVYRTSTNRDYGVGLVNRLTGTEDVEPFKGLDMLKEGVVCQSESDNCIWWACLHNHTCTHMANKFTLYGSSLICIPEVERFTDNPLYDEAPPKYYVKEKHNSDFGWREINGQTFAEYVCGDVKVVFDQANFEINGRQMPDWIENIANAPRTVCTLYVDWNPNKHGNLHWAFVMEKLEDLVKKITPIFANRYPTNRNNIEFFGYDVGVYIAAGVAKSFRPEVKRIHSFYGIAPPVLGFIGGKIYYDFTFNRNEHLVNTNEREKLIAREKFVIYRPPLEELINTYYPVSSDVLLLGISDFRSCQVVGREMYQIMHCFSELLRDEVALRYKKNRL